MEAGFGALVLVRIVTHVGWSRFACDHTRPDDLCVWAYFPKRWPVTKEASGRPPPPHLTVNRLLPAGDTWALPAVSVA
jgi:hypothetical protein